MGSSLMNTGLEALAAAKHITVNDLLMDYPEVLPPHPRGVSLR